MKLLRGFLVSILDLIYDFDLIYVTKLCGFTENNFFELREKYSKRSEKIDVGNCPRIP